VPKVRNGDSIPYKAIQELIVYKRDGKILQLCNIEVAKTQHALKMNRQLVIRESEIAVSDAETAIQ